MNKKDKEMEYQKGIDELYNQMQKFGRIDFVKALFDIKKELDIANKKLDRVKEYFDKDVKQELKYLYQKSNDFHKGKDYGDLGYGGAIQSVQAVSDNILSIIGGKDDK